MPTLTLESTVYTLQQLLDVPEAQVALAGRSNVGKSSLINALAVRKKLAKVSATPGKTRSINFYRVQPHNFFLVDLPGYGYARASHSERRSWAALLEKYLSTCKNLRALALLLDSRLPPQKLDLELAGFARSCGLPLLPILTKADKCNQRERAAGGMGRDRRRQTGHHLFQQAHGHGCPVAAPYRSFGLRAGHP